MEDYKAMYFTLFNKITNIIEELKEIQQKSEETYILANDNAHKEDE